MDLAAIFKVSVAVVAIADAHMIAIIHTLAAFDGVKGEGGGDEGVMRRRRRRGEEENEKVIADERSRCRVVVPPPLLFHSLPSDIHPQ